MRCLVDYIVQSSRSFSSFRLCIEGLRNNLLLFFLGLPTRRWNSFAAAVTALILLHIFIYFFPFHFFLSFFYCQASKDIWKDCTLNWTDTPRSKQQQTATMDVIHYSSSCFVFFFLSLFSPLSLFHLVGYPCVAFVYFFGCWLRYFHRGRQIVCERRGSSVRRVRLYYYYYYLCVRFHQKVRREKVVLSY